MVVEVVEMVVVRVLIAVIVKMKVVVKDYYYHHLLALVYSSIYISPGKSWRSFDEVTSNIFFTYSKFS